MKCHTKPHKAFLHERQQELKNVNLTDTEAFTSRRHNPLFKKSLFTDEYYEGGRCKNCHSTCEKCSGPNEWDCLSCSSPLLLQGSR